MKEEKSLLPNPLPGRRLRYYSRYSCSTIVRKTVCLALLSHYILVQSAPWKKFSAMDLLSAMRTWMSSNSALVDQLMSTQLRTSGTFGATFRVAATVGCMHCLFPMAIQLLEGMAGNIALRTSVLHLWVILIEMILGRRRHERMKASWNSANKRIMVTLTQLCLIPKWLPCVKFEGLKVSKLFATCNARDGGVICASTERAVEVWILKVWQLFGGVERCITSSTIRFHIHYAVGRASTR